MTEHHLDYDVVIIGSGAGGGTVARELADLAEQGLRVALLDAGGRFRKRDNTRREFEMARKYYVDNGGFQTASQDMTLAFCEAVGGSTNVYTGVTFRPPERVLQKWNVPTLDLNDLEPRLEKFEQENNVHLQPPENINRNNQLFREGCERLGWEVGQFPLNIRDCAGLNTCNIGCARFAKQGTAQVQIPYAEARGVEVIPFCRVNRIATGRIEAQIRPPEHGLPPAHYPAGDYIITAQKIIVAAGTMGTTPLLMRSFGKKAWPDLGRWFTCHPALTLVAEHEEQVLGSQGHPKSYYCETFVESDHFLLETCFYFPFVTAKNLVGFGPEADELMGRMDHQQQILVLVLDKARRDNRITIDRAGNPVVHYDIDATIRDAMIASIRAAGRLFFAAGAKRAHLPASGRFFVWANETDQLDELVRPEHFRTGQVAISAAHLMGGCRMGSDPARSVTDPWGRLHGVDGIYVADASLFPDSAEVNPYLTIMALASRVADAVRQDLGAA